MRSLRRCASNEFQAVAPRSGDFSSDIMSPSKKSLRATEQERADVARAQRRWIRKQGLLDPARLVFIDETATSTSLVRLRGRCPRGERLVGSVPAGPLLRHWNQSVDHGEAARMRAIGLRVQSARRAGAERLAMARKRKTETFGIW